MRRFSICILIKLGNDISTRDYLVSGISVLESRPRLNKLIVLDQGIHVLNSTALGILVGPIAAHLKLDIRRREERERRIENFIKPLAQSHDSPRCDLVSVLKMFSRTY